MPCLLLLPPFPDIKMHSNILSTSSFLHSPFYLSIPPSPTHLTVWMAWMFSSSSGATHQRCLSSLASPAQYVPVVCYLVSPQLWQNYLLKVYSPVQVNLIPHRSRLFEAPKNTTNIIGRHSASIRTNCFLSQYFFFLLAQRGAHNCSCIKWIWFDWESEFLLSRECKSY